MKAIVNGITIEGTPQEIAEYQRIMDDMRRKGIHIKPPLGKPPEWATNELTGGTTTYGAMAVVSLRDLCKFSHKDTN